MSGAAWTSSADVARIVERLRAAKSITILTHLKPDGDAVGSTLALARAMTRLGRRATPVYLKPWPARFDKVVGETPVVHERDGVDWTRSPRVSDTDLVMVCDTGSWSQVEGARAYLSSRRERTIIIDHHAHGDAEMAVDRLIDVRAAAACEIVADVVCEMLGVRASRLPVDIATPLYLGIATDTGWFRYSNTTARTLRFAGDLIDAGVLANELYQGIEQCDTEGRVRLIGRAVSGMELSYPRGQRGPALALLTVRLKDLAETGASVDEASGLTDLPQMIEAVRVVAVLIEQDDGSAKISLRSKSGAWGGVGEVDVNEAARTMGGGGHKHAAGARLKEPIDAARDRVRRVLTEAIP